MTGMAQKKVIIERLEQLGNLVIDDFLGSFPLDGGQALKANLKTDIGKLKDEKDLDLNKLYDILMDEENFFFPGQHERNVLFNDQNEKRVQTEAEFLRLIEARIAAVEEEHTARKEEDKARNAETLDDVDAKPLPTPEVRLQHIADEVEKEKIAREERVAALAKKQREEGVLTSPLPKKKVQFADLTVEGKMDAELDLIALFKKIKAENPELLEDFKQDKANPNKFKLIFPPKPTPSHQLKKDDKDEEVDKVAEKAPSTSCEFERKGNKATFTVQQPPMEMNVLVNIARMSKAMGYDTLKETDLPADYLKDNEEHGFTPNQILTLTAYKLGLSIQDKDGNRIEGDALIDSLEKQLGGNDVKMEALNKLVNESLPANERVKSLEFLDDPGHDIVSTSSPSSGR